MSDGVQHPAWHADETLCRLRAYAALFTALEEAVLASLSNTARLAREIGAAGEAEQMEQALRAHRVGLVKFRAVMGAHGLDVHERAPRRATRMTALSFGLAAFSDGEPASASPGSAPARRIRPAG